MKISSVLAILLFNGTAVFATNAVDTPHARFKNSLTKSIKNNNSPFKYNNPNKLVLHGHQEKPRISKILKFQMDKILSDYERHLSQGNMNRSNRSKVKNKLRSKFYNIKAYSKDRLRKEHGNKSLRRRSRNISKNE